MQCALKIRPSHSFYWFSIGRAFQDLSTRDELTLMERRHLLEEAEQYLERAISLEPTASLYHYRLGWVYVALSPHRQSAKRKAHNAFRRAVLLNPTNTKFRWAVADFYLNQYAFSSQKETTDRLEPGIDWARQNFQRHFRDFLEIHPHHDVDRVLDRCFTVTQNYDDLKGLIPDQSSYHLRFAEFLTRKGLWDRAKEEFQISLAQNPADPEVYHAYGSALLAHKHYEEALAIWRRQKEISPEDPRPYLSVSKALWTLNRKEESIGELERLVGVHPDHVAYWLTLTARLEESGSFGKTMDTYREALERNPGNGRISAQMAGYLMRQGNLSEAETSLRRAISSDPLEISYWDQLAGLYFQQKRYSRAIEEWKHLLKQKPEHIGALTGIARSYEQLGAWGGALGYYREAFATKPNDRSILRAIERIKKRIGEAVKGPQ
jgi:tetratricopeptide (TPR) repeat protein